MLEASKAAEALTLEVIDLGPASPKLLKGMELTR
jgi:hypothetical protein